MRWKVFNIECEQAVLSVIYLSHLTIRVLLKQSSTNTCKYIANLRYIIVDKGDDIDALREQKRDKNAKVENDNSG